VDSFATLDEELPRLANIGFTMALAGGDSSLVGTATGMLRMTGGGRDGGCFFSVPHVLRVSFFSNVKSAFLMKTIWLFFPRVNHTLE